MLIDAFGEESGVEALNGSVKFSTFFPPNRTVTGKRYSR